MIFPSPPVRLNYDYCSQFVGKKIKKWFIDAILIHEKRIRYLVSCDCGRKSNIVAYRVFKDLTSGCVSCGAIRHGLTKTPTWNSWIGAKNRCTNPNNKDYLHYGGRGIKFCERWFVFSNFLKDMGPKPTGLTLDRINNNGNYEPGNCRWASYSVQNSNQRRQYKLNGVKI